VTVFPTWQAAGLSLAVLVGHVLNGSGVLLFGVVAVGVIWALHRLRVSAPESATTADLISSVPGTAPAEAVRIVQFTAYALLAAQAAKAIAAMPMLLLIDPDSSTFPVYPGPALAVLAVAVAALLVVVLPTKRLATTATVLAALGLLVYFSVSVAVIVQIASGTPPRPPMEVGAVPAATEWGVAAVLVSLAIVCAGFEIPTAAVDRMQSLRRPLGLAVAIVALVALVAWVAANIGIVGEFRYDAAELVFIASDIFGGPTTALLFGATIALALAAVLVLIWGAARVVRRTDSGELSPVLATAGVTGVLTLLVSGGWGGASEKLWGVAGLLLLAVYVAVAQANSRLDDSTSAWALFAVLGFALAVSLFLVGVGQGWWPVLITLIVVAGAAAWAVKAPGQSGKPNSLTTP
jgi:hypothetical protein